MYRPKGYVNPYPSMTTRWNDPRYYDRVSYECFEAGANAMLEALIRQGRFNHAGYGTTDFPDARWGWFVFIPEG